MPSHGDFFGISWTSYVFFRIILNIFVYRISYVVCRMWNGKFRNQISKKSKVKRQKAKKEEGAEVQSNKGTKNKGKLPEIPKRNTQYSLRNTT